MTIIIPTAQFSPAEGQRIMVHKWAIDEVRGLRSAVEVLKELKPEDPRISHTQRLVVFYKLIKDEAKDLAILPFPRASGRDCLKCANMAEHYARYTEILYRAVALVPREIIRLGEPSLSTEEVYKKAVHLFFTMTNKQQTNKTAARKHGQEVSRAISSDPNRKLSLPPVIPLEELLLEDLDRRVFALLGKIALEAVPSNIGTAAMLSCEN